jgi:hypothetical protein
MPIDYVYIPSASSRLGIGALRRLCAIAVDVSGPKPAIVPTIGRGGGGFILLGVSTVSTVLVIGSAVAEDGFSDCISESDSSSVPPSIGSASSYSTSLKSSNSS